MTPFPTERKIKDIDFCIAYKKMWCMAFNAVIVGSA